MLALVACPHAAWAQLPIAPSTPAAPAAPAPALSNDAHGSGPAPGEQYYLDSAPPPVAPAPPPPVVQGEEPPFEPPLPIGAELEPPPELRHVAPGYSLWLGARLGWFVPFGNVWSRARPLTTSAGSTYTLDGVPFRDYASTGPMFELDAGLRLARAYTLFMLWERAELGSGDATSDGQPDGAESDFWALGLRASSNPDQLAFVTEVAIGYRRARSFYESGAEIQFTDAPFEARLGIGAELRLSRLTSLSSLITVGVGGFGTIERVAPNGRAASKLAPNDQGDGHGWVTLSVGAHFDFLASKH